MFSNFFPYLKTAVKTRVFKDLARSITLYAEYSRDRCIFFFAPDEHVYYFYFQGGRISSEGRKEKKTPDKRNVHYIIRHSSWTFHTAVYTHIYICIEIYSIVSRHNAGVLEIRRVVRVDCSTRLISERKCHCCVAFSQRVESNRHDIVTRKHWSCVVPVVIVVV